MKPKAYKEWLSRLGDNQLSQEKTNIQWIIDNSKQEDTVSSAKSNMQIILLEELRRGGYGSVS